MATKAVVTSTRFMTGGFPQNQIVETMISATPIESSRVANIRGESTLRDQQSSEHAC